MVRRPSSSPARAVAAAMPVVGDRHRLAHVAHRGGLAAIHQHVAGGDGLEPQGLDGGGGGDVVADEQLGVAAADQAEEEHRIGVAAELRRAAREQHHRARAPALHQVHAAVERGRGEQAAAHEEQIGLGHAGVLHGAFQHGLVLPEVGVDEHGQELAPANLRVLKLFHHGAHRCEHSQQRWPSALRTATFAAANGPSPA